MVLKLDVIESIGAMKNKHVNCLIHVRNLRKDKFIIGCELNSK